MGPKQQPAFRAQNKIKFEFKGQPLKTFHLNNSDMPLNLIKSSTLVYYFKLSEKCHICEHQVLAFRDHILQIKINLMDQGEFTEGNLYVEITPDTLDAMKYTNLVSDPGAGAIASFIGITRDTFDGKKVERLEYEAYVPMALTKLSLLCKEACKKWELIQVAMAHRTGVVAVGEASVVIVASSAHRKEALEAVHWAIDELKATVPIWKKEFFEGGDVWKENAESRARLLLQKEAGGGGVGDRS